jgi:hypothetical protein
MVKFFLKGTNQEVSVGDKVKITTPIKTPYGEVDSTFEVVVTQASLEQLIKDGLVIKSTPSLKPYVRAISIKLNLSIKQTYEFLDELKSAFPYAHYYLIMETIAEVMNGEIFCKSGYVVTPKGNVIPITDNTKISLPIFLNKEDAEKAKELLDIFRANLPYEGK